MRTLKYLGLLAVSMTLLIAVPSCTTDENIAPLANDGGGPIVPTDSGPGDAGTDATCASDATTCNACVTAAVDPYNACSGAAGKCVPFDNKRIPQGPNGGIPQVP